MRRKRSTHSEEYRAHLASPEWRVIRAAALERANHRCAFCGQTKQELHAKGRHLEVHHSTYQNLGNEQPADLTVLCAGRGGCHTAADRQRRLANGRRPMKRRRPYKAWRRVPKAGRRLIVLFVIAPLAVSTAPLVLPEDGNGILVGDSCERTTARVYLSKRKYPNIIRHIKVSWRKGYPHVLTIHRKHADERRERLLRGIPTKPGYDRDEAPSAVLRSHWRADVAYVPSSENRSAGARLGNAIEGHCNGSRFIYVFGP